MHGVNCTHVWLYNVISHYTIYCRYACDYAMLFPLRDGVWYCPQATVCIVVTTIKPHTCRTFVLIKPFIILTLLDAYHLSKYICTMRTYMCSYICSYLTSRSVYSQHAHNEGSYSCLLNMYSNLHIS